jgi:hypothetical protein
LVIFNLDATQPDAFLMLGSVSWFGESSMLKVAYSPR